MTERRVFKYHLDDTQTALDIPKDAEVLDIQLQGDDVMLWAIVPDTVLPAITVRRFQVVLTGETVPPNSKYIKTLQNRHGYVYHIFEIIQNNS